MPSPLEDEKIEEILDLWEEHEDVETVADEADVVQDTVRKYVKRAAEDEDERVDPASHDWIPGGDTGTAASVPGESPFPAAQGEARWEDYSGMTPGDFLKDFFEDFEVGVKNQWVALQAKRADRRNKLPSKEAFISDLLNMKSGIAQSAYREATYIADEYWAQAQQYLGQTGRDISENPISGEMVQPQPQQQGPPPGTYSNEPGWVGPGQRQPMQPQPGQQDSLIQMLLQQQQQMMQEFRQALQQQNQQQNDPGVVQAEVQKMMELKDLVDDLQGEGADKISEVLDGHFRNLQNQLASQPAGQAPAQGETLEEKLLTMAASNPDVSFEQVMQVIEKRGAVSNDPEVLKKEYEKKIREAELEHESKRYERFGEMGESLAERFGEAFGQSIVGGDKSEEQATSQEASAETDGGPAAAAPAAPPQAQPAEAEPCRYCGSDLRPGPQGSFCPDCGFAFAQCDLCLSPIEVPPVGQADHGYCPNCKSPMELADSADELTWCEACEWEGSRDDALAEAIECDGCGEFRPIKRPDDSSEQELALLDL